MAHDTSGLKRSLPLESSDAKTEAQEIRCESVVFGMDANGNVYSGKDIVGSLANTLVLTTKLKKVIDERATRLA